MYTIKVKALLSLFLGIFAVILLCFTAEAQQFCNGQSLSIVTTPLPAAIAGQRYSQQIIGTGGNPAKYMWSITAGQLPSGFSFTYPNCVANSGGVYVPRAFITGTTAQTGSFPITITLSDGTNKATKEFNINVVQDQSKLCNGQTSKCNGEDYLPCRNDIFIYNWCDENAPHYDTTKCGSTTNWCIGISNPITSLPQWNIYHGTPACGQIPNECKKAVYPKSYNLETAYCLKQDDNTYGWKEFSKLSLTEKEGCGIVNHAPKIVGKPEMPPSAVAGQPYTFTWKATDELDNNDLYWTINWGDNTPEDKTECPQNPLSKGQWWDFSKTHAWSNDGAYTIKSSLTDCKSGSDSDTSIINIGDITIAPESGSTIPDATAGQVYTAFITAQGGTPPYTWTIIDGTLPSGLTLTTDNNKAKISGIPTVPNSATGSVIAVPTGASITVPQITGFMTVGQVNPAHELTKTERQQVYDWKDTTSMKWIAAKVASNYPIQGYEINSLLALGRSEWKFAPVVQKIFYFDADLKFAPGGDAATPWTKPPFTTDSDWKGYPTAWGQQPGTKFIAPTDWVADFINKGIIKMPTMEWVNAGASTCVVPANLKPSGAITSATDSTTVTLSWDRVPNAVSYNVRLDDSTADRFNDERYETCPSSPHYYCENRITTTLISNVPLKAGRTYNFWVDPVFNPERDYCNGKTIFSVTKIVDITGDYSFTIKVTDSKGKSNSKQISIKINSADSITIAPDGSSTLPDATAGTPYTAHIKVSQGSSIIKDYEWTSERMPSWATISKDSDGKLVISGTPTIATNSIQVNSNSGGRSTQTTGDTGGTGSGNGGSATEPIAHFTGSSVINVQNDLVSGTYAANVPLTVSTSYDERVTTPAGGRGVLTAWCPQLASSPSPFTVYPNGNSQCTTNDPSFGIIFTSTNLNNFKNTFTFTLSSPDGTIRQSYTVTFNIPTNLLTGSAISNNAFTGKAIGAIQITGMQTANTGCRSTNPGDSIVFNPNSNPTLKTGDSFSIQFIRNGQPMASAPLFLIYETKIGNGGTLPNTINQPVDGNGKYTWTVTGNTKGQYSLYQVFEQNTKIFECSPYKPMFNVDSSTTNVVVRGIITQGASPSQEVEVHDAAATGDGLNILIGKTGADGSIIFEQNYANYLSSITKLPCTISSDKKTMTCQISGTTKPEETKVSAKYVKGNINKFLDVTGKSQTDGNYLIDLSKDLNLDVASGSFTIKIKRNGRTTSKEFNIKVNPSSGDSGQITLTTNPTSIPNGNKDAAYDLFFIASSGASPYAWSGKISGFDLATLYNENTRDSEYLRKMIILGG